MIHKTQAIVIAKKDLKAADRLLTLYTQDYGKILAKGRALKKNTAKLKGHLELFVHCYLMIAPGKSCNIITNAETINNFALIRSDLVNLACAYYFSELINKLIVAPEKDNKIWDLLLASFKKLNQPNSNIVHLAGYFENKLLHILGYDLRNQKCHADDFIKYNLGETVNSKKYINMLK